MDIGYSPRPIPFSSRLSHSQNWKPSLVAGSKMNPAHDVSGSDAKVGWKWNQMGIVEKKAVVNEEIKRMQRLPPTSSYASHRLRVLNKLHHLLSLQRTTSQDEELELLFSGLHL